jgi:hypothetical protein
LGFGFSGREQIAQSREQRGQGKGIEFEYNDEIKKAMSHFHLKRSAPYVKRSFNTYIESVDYLRL